MSQVESPTDRDVRRLVDHHKALGGIVILFDANSYSVRSYGIDKTRCAKLAKVADAIADALQDGRIGVPDLGSHD